MIPLQLVGNRGFGFFETVFFSRFREFHIGDLAFP